MPDAVPHAVIKGLQGDLLKGGYAIVYIFDPDAVFIRADTEHEFPSHTHAAFTSMQFAAAALSASSTTLRSGSR